MITLTKEKERRKRKSKDKEREKKRKMVALLVSYNGYFGGRFWPFGGIVFKNQARYKLKKTRNVFFNVFITFLQN